MANESDLRRSIFETLAASTTLVSLTGQTSPGVRWGDRGAHNRPRITYFTPSAGITGGPFDALNVTGQFDVFVESNSTGVEDQIADEIETVITQTNLSSTARTSPVDVAPTLRARREIPELDEGRRRLTLEYSFRFNR